MLLKIYDHERIDEVQDKFNECFPYLRIEFYNHPHRWHEASPEEDLVQGSTYIEDIRKTHESGVISIKSWDKTGFVEQEFRRLFGLHVQIFRLHKGKWMQTTDADELTLKELSDQAQQSQQSLNQAPEK